MAATFVNVTKVILKVPVHYFLSNIHLCNYNKTIIRLSKHYSIIPSTLSRGLFNNIHFVEKLLNIVTLALFQAHTLSDLIPKNKFLYV